MKRKIQKIHLMIEYDKEVCEICNQEVCDSTEICEKIREHLKYPHEDESIFDILGTLLEED